MIQEAMSYFPNFFLTGKKSIKNTVSSCGAKVMWKITLGLGDVPDIRGDADVFIGIFSMTWGPSLDRACGRLVISDMKALLRGGLKSSTMLGLQVYSSKVWPGVGTFLIH